MRLDCPAHSYACLPGLADVRHLHQNGHDYFYALSEILENAKETVYIADWWLTPELFLRRPPAEHPEFRLDRLLLRKAEQGVDIYVMVYKVPPRAPPDSPPRRITDATRCRRSSRPCR